MSIKRLHYTTFAHILVFCLLGTGGLGCPATAWESVRESQDIDQLWRFIQENPEDPRADDIRIRVASIEFKAAKEANTRFAYNAFLERHPETSMALDARRRLEELDFKLAKAAGSAEALAAFLRRHPAGRSADQARALRARLHCERLGAVDDAESLDRGLRRHTDLPCRGALENRLRQLRLKAAMASGRVSRLMAFVQTYGQEDVSSEARHRLLVLQLDALIQAARFEQARAAVQERADSDKAAALLARLEGAERAWEQASFEPTKPRSARRTPLDRSRLTLAQATGRLRAPRAMVIGTLVKASDPRKRWLATDSLALLADEAATDALMVMLGDAFLEVRRRAWIGLKRSIDRLGPIRGPIWLQGQRSKLHERAKAGTLLFRRATLTALSGETGLAWNLLGRVMAESEQPDLLALERASHLALDLGLDKDAARTARAFSDHAQRFASQRIEAWRTSDGISKSEEGWLILRQLHGLAILWQQTLTPFQIGPDGSARVREYTVILGPWTERSRRHLATLTRWLENEEGRWARTHPGYRPSPEGAGKAGPLPSMDTPDPGDVVLLALVGGRPALPTLAWTACCHPHPGTRLAAATWTAAAGLARALPAAPVSF